MLKGKTVVLAVSGSIAAYKIPNLARMLKKLHADVYVLMTQNATQFITPLTFETLTNHKCLIDTFDRNFEYSVEHVALAKKADIVLIAPASANVIGKIACGIADDMLTTTVMACTCKKLIAPAMNHNMLHNPIVQDNLAKLKRFNYEMIEPDSGMLANGDIGDGRMPDESVLLQYILKEIAFEKDLIGKNILITAGATQEAIDPVRYITNHSTGKMGCALAQAAMYRGANVTLVHGHLETKPPMFINKKEVSSAKDMFKKVKDLASKQNIIIKAAAVADFTPSTVSQQKIKKFDSDLSISLSRTDDILSYLGKHKSEKQILCGFSMETENMVENSKKKLIQKNCDLICANSLVEEGAGFGTDTNIVTLISKNKILPLEKLSKFEVANSILDQILTISDIKKVNGDVIL